jgi:CBS domain-containing protein
MKVDELIKKRGGMVYRVQSDTTVADAAKILLEKDVGAVLVCDGERIVGIFTRNDIVRRYVENPAAFSGTSVASVPARPVFSAILDDDLGELFKEMVRRGIHHVPVIDGGRAVGMITPIDIVVHLKEAIQYENLQLINYIQGIY